MMDKKDSSLYYRENVLEKINLDSVRLDSAHSVLNNVDKCVRCFLFSPYSNGSIGEYASH